MSKVLTLKDGLKRLRRVLLRFGRFRKRWRVLDGAAKFVLAAPGALLVWFFLDWAFNLWAWPLVILFAVVCGIWAWGFVKWLVLPRIWRIRADREAVALEALHGELDNRLIGSLQLGTEVAETEDAGEDPGYSAGMVKALVSWTVESLKGINTHKLLDRSRARRRLAGAVATIAVAVLCVLFARDAVVQRWDNLVAACGQVLDDIFPVDLTVQPGDLAVVRGRPVTLSVLAEGAHRDEIVLVRIDNETEESIETPLELVDDAASFTLAEAENAFSYHFRYGRRPSAVHQILVEDLPEVRAINYEVTPPPYTGQPMRMMTGRLGKLQGLPGTQVLVSFAASTKLQAESCYVEWMTGEKQSIDVSGRFGSFAFTVDQPERVAIHLTGHFGEGFEMPRPVSFEIVVIQDRAPSIELRTRLAATELEYAAAAGMNLRCFAKDDFGVQEVGVKYVVDVIEAMEGVTARGKREGSQVHVIDPPRERVKDGFRSIYRGMRPKLKPGDRVTLSMWAQDNNTETGPGRSRSDSLEFVVVSRGTDAFALAEIGSIASRDKSAMVLADLERVEKSEELMAPPEKILTTERPRDLRKLELDAVADQEIEPGEFQDAIGRYRELLSGSVR